MRQTRIAWFSVLLISAAVLAGCTQDLSTTPLPDAPHTAAANPHLVSASQLIGADGGTVAIPGASVTLPPGALATTTLISITQLSDGSLDLGPEGTYFLVPVTLELASTDPGATVVRWYNPAVGRWVTIPSTPGAGCRRAPLAHFSLYQVVINETVE